MADNEADRLTMEFIRTQISSVEWNEILREPDIRISQRKLQVAVERVIARWEGAPNEPEPKDVRAKMDDSKKRKRDE